MTYEDSVMLERAYDRAPGWAPPQTTPADRPDSVSDVAASVGNARFIGAVAGHRARFRAAAPPTLARKPARAPDAAESIGGSAETAQSVPGSKGAGPLAAGDVGFTSRMLKGLAGGAGRHFADYKDAHLTEVVPSFDKLHSIQKPHAGDREDDAKNPHDEANGGDLMLNAIRRAAPGAWQAKSNQWTTDEGRITSATQIFNAAVPRANHMFASLGKLETMQEMLGVTDPEAMSTAVVKSLEDASAIAERVQEKGEGSLDVPVVTEKVSMAAKDLSTANKSLHAASLPVRSKLALDKAGEIKAQGAGAEARQAEINKKIATLKGVGQVIDFAMLAKGSDAEVAGSGGTATLDRVSSLESTVDQQSGPTRSIGRGGDPHGEYQDGLDDVQDSVSKATVGESTKKIGSTVQSTAKSTVEQTIGLEIPTEIPSAAYLLETAGKIYFRKELEGIRRELGKVQSIAQGYNELAEALDVEADVKLFEAAIDQYLDAETKLEEALHQRMQSYLKLGQQLDSASRKDPDAKGMAPGKDQERFATVMTVTAAVRETLALGRGALDGFGLTPSGLLELAQDVERNRQPLEWPSEEREAVFTMYNQLEGFQGNVERLGEQLGPIEKAAGKMMNMAAGGGDNATPGDPSFRGAY